MERSLQVACQFAALTTTLLLGGSAPSDLAPAAENLRLRELPTLAAQDLERLARQRDEIRALRGCLLAKRERCGASIATSTPRPPGSPASGDRSP